MGALYFMGDLAELTGKTAMLSGGLFNQVCLKEGRFAGECRWIRADDCACHSCSCGTGHKACRCPSPYYAQPKCLGTVR